MVDAGASAKAEMLAAARKKLRDFESRQKADGRASPESSVISSEPGAGAGLNGRSSVVSEESAIQPHSSVQSVRNGVMASPFQPNGNEWYQAYTQLKGQHDELVSHYAQLHSAYSQVNANGVHVDAENQIVQLQAALSTMVEEKLSCQSDLRQANEKIEQLRQKLSVQPATPQMPQNNNNEEVRKLTEAIAQKDALLTARHQELENSRREVAAMQASLVNVQHERSEAQARVKSLIRETGEQQARVEQLKKDMQMKDLYLKQLGGGQAQGVGENGDDLRKELEVLKAEKTRLLTETATLKAHYSEREFALQQKQSELAQELDQLHYQKHASDERIQQLEHELSIAKSELVNVNREKPEEENASEEVQITEESVLQRVQEARVAERRVWEKKMLCELQRWEDEVGEKDKAIFEREQALAELEMKYRLLEERTLESTANGADLLSLSEQLQNEKATVSRAVAQNKELKERLLETEDRFVLLTEEKAAVELAKQSAEHQVRELSKQLNLEAAGLVTNISEVIASQPHLEPETSTATPVNEDLKNELESLQKENSEMRENLEQKTVELQQVRAELRRSNTHNEQMDEIMRQNAEDENQNSIHVELTQAVGRVQELAAENEQLREAVGEVRRQLEEERENRRSEVEQLKEQSLQKEVVVEKVPEQPTRELHEDLWARKELEKRFARAMMQNAELVETIDRLEHINQQLELENDTIADHVVLYQHQRKLVRERLRVKDEQLKSMEEERTRTVARCQELQNVLMTVLNKGGVLKEYETTSLSRKAARRVSRSYSHSTVDEMSGDEDIVVDAKLEAVPEREKVHGAEEKSTEEAPIEVKEGKEEEAREEEPQDASVRRILEIISDISRPQPIVTAQLHCTQCIGPLLEL